MDEVNEMNMNTQSYSPFDWIRNILKNEKAA